MKLLKAGKTSRRSLERFFDVSGAGDTVIAAAAMALAGGATLRHAAELANRAAGIVVGKLVAFGRALKRFHSPATSPSGHW